MIDLRHADCLAVLRELPSDSIDAVVTDPPYGLAEHKRKDVERALLAWLTGDREHVPTGRGFMGKEWDRFVPPPAVWDECFRVLKPGGHLLAFAGTRTFDLMAISIRLAGLGADVSPEIRDGIAWLYGSGFPKSRDVSKAIDKTAGATREVVGRDERLARYMPNGNTGSVMLHGCQSVEELEALATAGAVTPDGTDARATLARRERNAELFNISCPLHTPAAEHGRPEPAGQYPEPFPGAAPHIERRQDTEDRPLKGKRPRTRKAKP